MIRVLTALLLSLVLAVTSVTLAVARGQSAGQSAGLTEMVICSDGVARTVFVDASGVPVDHAAHHCPDCLLALDQPRPLAVPVRIAPVALAAVAPALADDAETPRPVRAAPPRGPPVLS